MVFIAFLFVLVPALLLLFLVGAFLQFVAPQWKFSRWYMQLWSWYWIEWYYTTLPYETPSFTGDNFMGTIKEERLAQRVESRRIAQHREDLAIMKRHFESLGPDHSASIQRIIEIRKEAEKARGGCVEGIPSTFPFGLGQDHDLEMSEGQRRRMNPSKGWISWLGFD